MVNNNLLLSLIQEVKPIFWYYIMPPGGNTCTAERINVIITFMNPMV